MNKLILFFLLLLASINSLKASNDPYNVKIEINGIKNDFAILAYYFSDTKYIKDTITFDENGIGIIDDVDPIPTGIYLLAFPTLEYKYFEFILGEEKKFSIKTDTLDFVDHMEIKGSKENELFYANLKFMIDKGTKANEDKEKIKDLKEGSPEYIKLKEELETIDKEIKSFKNDIIAKHPESFYTKLLLLMADLDIPENPDPTDSSFAYRYYQKHYFDNINLQDERLTRTPVFLNKIIRFLDYYTIPSPDSINTAIDMILEKAKPNYNTFQYLVQSIFNKYAKSNIMYHELVYVHIAKAYYSDSLITDWVDHEQREKIMEVLRKKEPTLLGKAAPDIFIKDITGINKTLYEEIEKNDYTILVFWNSSCGHCKKEIPLLRDTYDNEIKALGKIGIFAISTEVEYDECMKFVNEHVLVRDGWTNCIDLYGSNPFRSKYDVVSTPLLLVLDHDKKILAKRISIEDIKGLIEFDRKNKNK